MSTAAILVLTAALGLAAGEADIAPAIAPVGEEAIVETALAEPEVDFSALVDPLDALLEPAAICRMRPQCDVDADCDAICGAGLGDCVRSRCPIRVCRCG